MGQASGRRLLDEQREPVKALAHVGVARRQPHPNARRDRDHRRDSALTTRASAAASTSASTTTRSPPTRAISIRPAGADGAGSESYGRFIHQEGLVTAFPARGGVGGRIARSG